MSTVQELTYAAAAAMALQQAMEADPNIVALGEDLGRGGVFGQYRGLPQQFGPERIIDTPISEANIMGAAVGMALAGLRPVVEMRVIDFALCAMDEIVNQAAKNRYMFGGQGRVPCVIRMPIGIWSASVRANWVGGWLTTVALTARACRKSRGRWRRPLCPSASRQWPEKRRDGRSPVPGGHEPVPGVSSHPVAEAWPHAIGFPWRHAAAPRR